MCVGGRFVLGLLAGFWAGPAGEGATLASEAAGEEFFQALATGVVQDLAGLVLPGRHTAMAPAPHVGRAFLRAIGPYRAADRPGIPDAYARLPFGRRSDTHAPPVPRTHPNHHPTHALSTTLEPWPH